MTPDVKEALISVLRFADQGPDGLGGDLTDWELNRIAQELLRCFNVEAK